MTVFNINLIATRRRQKQRARAMLRLGLYSLIALLGIAVVVYLRMDLAVNQVTAQIAEVNARLSDPAVADSMARIEFLDLQNKELTPRVQVLQKVHDSEAEWIRILHDISASIPPRVWIGQMTTQRNDKAQTISLRGKAFTQSDVGAFMLALDQPGWSAAPALGFSQSTQDPRVGARVIEFEVAVPLQSVIGSDLK